MPDVAGTITRQLRREHKALAAILGAARERADLTQRALARTLGWQLVIVQRIESGQRRLAVDELFPYAAALNTTPERVLRALRRRLLPDTHGTKPSAPDSGSRRQSSAPRKRVGKGSRLRPGR
jgi:transcriptional regulator with XRE-family HTH domain